METTFIAETGALRLTDLMPVASETQKANELFPDHELLRKIECYEGSVEIEIVFDPRPDYGRGFPKLRKRSALTYLYEYGSQAFALSTDVNLSQPTPPASVLTGTVALRAGEQRYFSMVFSHGYPAVMAPLGNDADTRISRSVDWWDSWVSNSKYSGPYQDEVIRSALTLKLMTYAPSGAIVAAPTTSLPEKIGGVRNWDYRYCWTRDASLTMRALLDLGFTIEGEAYVSWLLHATRLTWPAIQIVYDVYGESHLPERELQHLAGYRQSIPVRIGNDAAKQLQLDTYGEVIDATFQYVIHGGRLDRTTGRMLVGLGKTVCRRWREPDEGIWEPRQGRQHHTHSVAMCYVALDRLIKLHGAGHIRVPLPLFEREKAAIRQAIETRGYNRQLESYVTVLDGDDVDASLLLLGLNGYADTRDLRMRNTYARVRERLGIDGLLYRYLRRDGLPPGEGTFGICAFWGVEHLARQGERQTARTYFEKLLSFMNDVGLFAEEIDPESGAALGNFPQAFTHVGLINAAVALSEES